MALTDDDLRFYSAAGMAAVIPGFQLALDRLQEILDQMRTQMMALRAADAPPLTSEIPTAAKRVKLLAAAKAVGGWSPDPEERKREMARRMAARQRKARVTGAKKRWAGMSVRDRKEWSEKMQRGRQKAQRTRRKPKALPAVKMEPAA